MYPKSISSKRAKKSRGAVLVITTLMLLFVILPAVGLAIDGGVAFAVRARLQTATDGAALAGARSLSRGISLSAQRASAAATADEFFHANIDHSWTSLVSPAASITWPAAPPKTTIIRIDASVGAPTYFMRMFGYDSLTVRASGAANRRDVNIVMVLDRSNSLDAARPGDPNGSCDNLRAAAVSFVDTFVDGRDRIGLVTFGTTYRVDFAPAFDFKTRSPSVINHINNVLCVGGTNAAAAYWNAWLQLQTINEPGTLNVILFFTDGQPNTVVMNNMEVKTTAPASTCVNTAPKNGVITPAGTQVWGIFKSLETHAPPANDPDWSVITGSGGCKYNTNGRYWDVPLDIVALTRAGAANEYDAFGNALTGYKTPIRRDANNRIRINDWETVTNAGTNALDSAASRVRALSGAAGLDVISYCIALGGPSAPEDILMRRVCNVQANNPNFDNTKPEGMYVLAADGAQLEQAFNQLASDILRISH